MNQRWNLLSLAGAVGLLSWCATPALAAGSTQAAVDPPATGPRLTVGGQVFSNFHVPTSAFETNRFDITRARVYANGVFNRTWSGHVVLNTKALGYMGVNGQAASQPNMAMLKMAYMQADNLVPGNRLRLGMIITPWFDYEASAWGYRMLGFLPSAGGFSNTPGPSLTPFYDNGISFAGDRDVLGFKKFFGYDLAIINGESNPGSATSGHLDYEGRFTLRPLSGLDLTWIAHRRTPGGSGIGFERYAGLAVYRAAWGRAAFEGNWSHDDAAGGIGDGQILGGWAIVNLPFLPVSSQLVLRGDRIDGGPGTGGTIGFEPSQGFRYETIAGIAVKPIKNITLMLDNENADWHLANGSAYKNTDQVALHTQMSF